MVSPTPAAVPEEAQPLAEAALAGGSHPEDRLRGRRDIVNRQRLQEKIAATWFRASTPERARSEILDILKEAQADGRDEIERRFHDGASGLMTAQAFSFLADQLLRLVYDHVSHDLYPLHNPSTAERLTLVAVGGYGRGELAPYSDIDLLFLLPYKITPRSEQVIEAMLYFLWDLGFKVGHATRSVEDCIRLARNDVTIATNLLEKRFLWGDQALFLELREGYQSKVQNGRSAAFVEAKLAERDARHQRHGEGSRYALEPNIKEGKGGLRDLHTLFWIAKFAYSLDDIERFIDTGVFSRPEVRKFAKALAFFWTLRCHLHFLTGRAEERLTFDLQQQIAPLMGYKQHAGSQAVERFMKHYFLMAKDVGDLTRIFCAQLEAEHERRSRFRLAPLLGQRRLSGFQLDGDRLWVKDAEVFQKNPVEMLRIFQVAQQNDLDIHPQTLRWITRNLKYITDAVRKEPKANAIFLDILTSEQDPEVTLRRMNEAGVFGRFIRDFGRIVSQMQFNMYHHYTVDEHTIFAIGILHDIEQGRLAEEAPIVTDVVHKVLSRRVLYVAVLLHDIAKGRPGDHSEVGAEIAQRLCPRLGLTEEETETVAWLVLHHLKMSDTAFKRDIDDPQTIQSFADLVQSMERLRLLLILTVADIRAVGPNVWSAWKAALLRELYWRTEEVLSGGLITEGRERRVEAAQQALRAQLSDWPAEEVEAHLERGYASYWLSLDAETHARHAELVREAEAAGRQLTVDTRIDDYRQVTEVTIYTPDHPGLFSRIAGALAVAGASVEGARIFTLSNGMALDIFYIEDATGGPFDRTDKLERLRSAIEASLTGRLKPQQELKKQGTQLPSRLEVFKVPPRVLIDNKASRNHTVVEVNARDRPGLLHRITEVITRQHLIIDSAKVTTYGERAVDAFYLHDALGSKVEDQARLRRLRHRLLEALETTPGGAEPARKAPARGKGGGKARAARQGAAKPVDT
ncbi:[protein-PII] uridylyltransferase [Fodinicurvata fenggangensis]|uniref:[protein-PII] uridylyltransferase n=1 Tax=Fodinicurvata fenggangensis TaxID=1121830 RepID=UPI0009E08524|nr:[protein-PII] uridylyltransferase [Fodinicurvata fenggangensis]